MEATLVLIRHGQSTWNAQNRFTGWVDVPLAPRGWQEAEAAGKLLADTAFDAAYTSHLQRAICTLQVVLRENRSGRLPIFIPAEGSTPRESYKPGADEFPVHFNIVPLAERHYGDLQGLNKDQVKEQHGEKQFKQWRRGFDTPPPNGESLKDTCDRVIPYYQENIHPRLVAGQTILVSAHGNSLRALTKHLEGISDQEIVKLEIPTGTPIIYTLGDGNGRLEITGKHVTTLST